MPRKTAKVLTALSVEKATPPAAGRKELFDARIPGFALRVTSTGHKSWVLFYRLRGRNRRLTIGGYPAIKLDMARKLAREALDKVADGGDPAGDKVAARKAEVKRDDRFETVAATFIEKYAKRHTRGWAESERIFKKYVNPHWGQRHIADITRRDVIELLDDMVEHGTPIMANRTLAAVRKLYNWCLTRDIVDATPVARVAAPGRETQRERVLSDDEIKAIWEACEALGYPFGPLVRLLLVTAQRREEVAGMRWSDIDLEAALWTLPREMTKADRVHEVPLSSLALEIIGALTHSGDYLLTSGRRGDKPVSGFSVAKKRLDELSGMTDWRLHDLRRTAGTNMARDKVATSTISRIMNHAEGGVTKIYRRYGFLDEKREALAKWSRRLEAILGRDETKVVQLRGVGAST